MINRDARSRWLDRAVVSAMIMNFAVAQTAFAAEQPLAPGDTDTTTPIKHVIVIIGENRTFDHVFATYTPKSNDKVLNLLSEGIVKADGSPGANFSKANKYGQALQMKAEDAKTFEIAPGGKTPYKTLTPPSTGGAPTASSDSNPPPFATLEAAANYEYGLYPGDLKLITTGGTGLPTHVPDTRIKNVDALPSGPFQLTNGTKLPYDAYAGSPVHRFYQMWQQMDCSIAHATALNPTGCINDLFNWVEDTIDAGDNGESYKSFKSTEGAIALGFFNMAEGDVPYFKQLADTYSISDNFHQSVSGGTGANHIMLGYADAIYYSAADGSPAAPPSGQIENPNPQKGSNNIWVNDGYGSTTTGDGGSYTECADTAQPGVSAITSYLKAVKVEPRCQAGAFYLLNNYNPYYVGDGQPDPSATGPFTIPGTTQRHIGDDLSAGNKAGAISWRYYGESWSDYVQNPSSLSGYLYCNICNPFGYATDIMTGTDPATGIPERDEHIDDTTALYDDIANNILPAVSIVKPSALNDGHPASSKLGLFESFTKKIVAAVESNPALAGNTAIFITFDEGGGSWDSGYVQPVDYFGDGTRIPLIVVSPYSKGGHVSHSYADHVSIDKFIEANWKLEPITKRSRDNLPNPKATAANPYVPTNRPAIGDLMDLFTF